MQLRTTQCFTTQPCVKYTDFFKSKFGSFDPRRYTPEHTHIATIAISLCVRYTRTSTISYSSTHVTTALHSATPPHQCVKHTVTNHNNNTHSTLCECPTPKHTQIILSQFTHPRNNTCDIFQQRQSLYKQPNSQTNNQTLYFKPQQFSLCDTVSSTPTSAQTVSNNTFCTPNISHSTSTRPQCQTPPHQSRIPRVARPQTPQGTAATLQSEMLTTQTAAKPINRPNNSKRLPPPTEQLCPRGSNSRLAHNTGCPTPPRSWRRHPPKLPLDASVCKRNPLPKSGNFKTGSLDRRCLTPPKAHS